MIPEGLQIPFVISVIVLLIVTLVTDKIKTSLVFLFAVVLLLIGGSIGFNDFISGISNPSILTIFTLIVLTAGVNDYVNMGSFFDHLFGKGGSQRGFILRMGLSVSAVSSVMNNTPVVAMMMPYVYQWGKKFNINPSRLLLPLSYSAIVGGVITLIGTSTNLVLNGLITDSDLTPLGFTDFVLPGILVTLACIFFMYLLGPYLMRDKPDILTSLEEHAREYLVETRIHNGSGLVGQSVEQAGLRNLQQVYLTEIIRHKTRIAPVKPGEILEEGDLLLFAGDTGPTLQLIEKFKGLELSEKSFFNIKDKAEIIEAIVQQNSELDRKTAKEVGFREKFDAAIIGIHRRGEKLMGKIGAMPLKTGDLLLLTAGSEFRDRNNRSNDLLIVNTIQPREDMPRSRVVLFTLAAALGIGLIAFGVLSLLYGLLVILFAQLLLNMTNVEKIKQNISFDLLIILVSSLAIGQALIDSGAAGYITDTFFQNANNWSPLGTLAGVFAVTFLLTSFITNVAAVTIIFPIVFSLAVSTNIAHEALFLTAAFGASCCFATPFAYQTNLMVMEAGNYSFRDFARLGIPLSLIYGLVFLTFAALKFDLV